MDCADAESALAQLFDDALAINARALCLHIAVCVDCRELFANMLLGRAACKVARREWGNKRPDRFPKPVRSSLSPPAT